MSKHVNALLTLEDHEMLRFVKQETHKRRTRIQALDLSVLRPWMRTYAAWLAMRPGRPTVTERRVQANLLAHDDVGEKTIRIIEARSDFRELLAKFEESAVALARSKLENDLPFYVEQHRKGLEMALAADDYKKIPDYTNPALERVWPRRDGANVASANVTITLSAGQVLALDVGLPVIEAEVVADPATPPPADAE